MDDTREGSFYCAGTIAGVYAVKMPWIYEMYPADDLLCSVSVCNAPSDLFHASSVFRFLCAINII